MTDSDLEAKYMIQFQGTRGDWVNLWSGPVPEKTITGLGGPEAVMQSFLDGPGGFDRPIRLIAVETRVIAELKAS